MEARHDVDAAADLRYDAIPGVLQRIRGLERRKKEPLGACHGRAESLWVTRKAMNHLKAFVLGAS